jgi:hypothetical protein
MQSVLAPLVASLKRWWTAKQQERPGSTQCSTKEPVSETSLVVGFEATDG